MKKSDPTGFYDRGYIPHVQATGLIQLVTFRLADSMPNHVLKTWEEELAHLPDEARNAERRRRMENYLDQGAGECWLRRSDIAQTVVDTVRHFDGERYRLHEWVVMPNHVHVLVEFSQGFTMSTVVESWKKFSARKVNAVLGREGAFWFREYHDRFIRDEEHLYRAADYVRNNPVKAGLCSSAADWPFGSAAIRGLLAAWKERG